MTLQRNLCLLSCPARLRVWLCAPILVICGGVIAARAQTPPPVLISQPTSTRAIALESLNFVSEPFKLESPHSFGTDRRTRVMLFAVNLSLQPGESLSSLSADAEDTSHRHYNLQVEYAGPVPQQEWLTAVVLRLSDDLGNVGDVLVRVTHAGVGSNRVRIAIGHVGGGPADDPGAGPTPAPPYLIAGKVMSGGLGLSGVTVKLTGSQTETQVTDAGGAYQFTVLTAGGNYSITPEKPYYDFSVGPIFKNLSNHQTDVNFAAIRHTYTINGKVFDDKGQGLDAIQMTARNVAGVIIGTAVSASGGNYSFPNLPAGFSYSLTPASNSFYTFAAQSPGVLGGNLTVNFTGALRKYTINGRIAEGSVGVSGVNVALSGSQPASATTDASGNYTFTNLNAGGNYTLVPSKTYYVFTPASQAVNNLGGDQNVNFNGAPRYQIRGRVADNSGRGVAGATVTMGGSESRISVTAADGSYSFTVSPGSYMLTPSIEQDWYSFGPSNQSLNSISGDQTVNFTATPAPIPNPPYVLEFDGSPKSVDYGYYWDPGVDLGHFFWEFWAMPGNNAGATYMLSDGYGGAHALLFGVANLGSSEPGRYQLMGNLFNGITHENYFRGDQGPAPGEWGHFAVGWDGQNIITYLNGVPVGKTPFAGPRRTPGPGEGGSWLLIGGSTHSNFVGRIAQVRGYEVSNPREDPTGIDKTLVEASFTPQTVFVGGGNLLSYYFRPAARVADLSQGYQGKSHVGLVRGTFNWYFDPCTGCPLPQFVIDPTAPNFATGAPAPPAPVGNPPAAPAGARIFDSFSRPNSTYVLNGKGGLGNTEGGAAGAKAWRTTQDSSQRQPFGILNGRAVMLANATYLTWIPTDSSAANLDIRVERRAGSVGSGLDTGLSFRVLDDRNFFFAYTSAGTNASSPRLLTVGYYVGGQRVNLVTGVNMPASWTTLRVITRSSGQITVYAGATQVYTTTNGFLPTASGAGLYNNSPGLGLVNRWDNFAVYDAP